MDEFKNRSSWHSNGEAGGVSVDPKALTEEQLEKLSREYVRKVYDILGSNKDVPAPDVNTNPKIIDWMTDEYVKLARKTQLKPQLMSFTQLLRGKQAVGRKNASKLGFRRRISPQTTI